MYTTLAEYDTAIANVQAAITRQLKLGNHHGNKSGGSEFVTTEALLPDLYSQLANLQRERALLADPQKVVVIGIGW